MEGTEMAHRQGEENRLVQVAPADGGEREYVPAAIVGRGIDNITKALRLFALAAAAIAVYLTVSAKLKISLSFGYQRPYQRTRA
jgi:hypothetical protein